MAILNVGPNSTYATIADAQNSAIGGDHLLLEAGYSNESVSITVENLFVGGGLSSANIQLTLAPGVSTVTLEGDAPITVFDNTGSNVITGNAGANEILVTQGNDVAHGGAGVDLLAVDYRDATTAVIGTATNISDGGSHAVTFDGFENFYIGTGSGNDTITVGNGANRITSGSGNDTITGGDGGNIIRGQGGNDTITAGNGDNNVGGGSGNDTITTGTGEDLIFSGLGDDTVIAGAGDDSVFGDGGVDTVDAGADFDLLTLDYSSSTTNVTGGVGGGTLAAGYSGTIADVAGTSSTAFTFTEHFDITTGSGNDNIVAGDGDDTLSGGAGMDTLSGRDGMDTITGGAGMDTLKGGLSDDVLNGGSEADYLTGGLGADTFVYQGLSDSTGLVHDLIHGFDGSMDHFDLDVSVVGVNRAVNGGQLDNATFDADSRSGYIEHGCAQGDHVHRRQRLGGRHQLHRRRCQRRRRLSGGAGLRVRKRTGAQSGFAERRRLYLSRL